MRLCWLLVFSLGIGSTVRAAGQGASPDLQIAQTLIAEIRELRRDIRSTVAGIQRIQIVMYRLQAQNGQLEKATQRLDQVRAECKSAEMQQQFAATQIEQAEATGKSSQNVNQEKVAEQLIFRLRRSLQPLADQIQKCHADEIDAENQFRTEQAKMNELEGQLDRLDTLLAGNGQK
ncbi:MAG TPA: hypothetical protein VKX49_01265 [Bryobacteraceae bacterium]|nr:hypothetical protein [Bryobacteraceae bacterium]